MHSTGEQFASIKVIWLFTARLLTTIIFLLLFPSTTIAKDLPVHFDHLSTEDGLSQNSVYAILQDSQGFMWFGTRLGLNRYDGVDFKVFSYNPLDEKSIPGYKVTELCEDKDGVLWVGTSSGGLCRYVPSEESFVRLKHDPDNSNSLPDNSITALFSDSEGDLWVGTENGLSKYDKSENRYTNFFHEPENLNSLRQNRISSIIEFPAGMLWVGTENGSLTKMSLEDHSTQTILEDWQSTSVDLKCMITEPDKSTLIVGLFGEGNFRYDLRTDKLEFLSSGTEVEDIILRGPVSYTWDKRGQLWIGTVAGLASFDPITKKILIFRHDKNDPSSLSDNLIYSTYVDRQGILWVGTESSGISRYDPGLLRFAHHKNEEGNTNSLPSNMVFSIAEDINNNIWFATTPGGVSVMDISSGDFTHYEREHGYNHGWNTNYASRVKADSSGTIYMGTLECGFFTLDTPTQKLTHYRNREIEPTSFSDKTTKDILVAQDGSVWIATESQGLDRFDKPTGTFEHFRHEPGEPNSINSNFTYCLFEDHAGVIWVGTADNGLNRFDRETEIFSHYEVDINDESSIVSDCVLSLFEDDRNNLWVGTRSGGLSKLDPARRKFSPLDLGVEPARLTVYGILQDDHNYLWLSTNYGIMKAHPDSGLVNNYTTSDGVMNGFYFSSCLKASNALMYFGGQDGYNVFHPDSIKNNPYIPPIVLTRLTVNYEDVPIGDDSNGQPILEQSLSQTRELHLNYRHKVIRFEFAALNFSASYKNYYAYKLEGFDEDWIYSGTENYAQYMNLPAGHYTFRVRGSNNDGVWNKEGASLGLVISPPFWKTWWFNSLLVLSLLSSTFLYIQLKTVKLISEQAKLEAMVRERTAELKSEIEERQRVESEKTQLKLDHLKRELLTQSLHLNDKQQIMDSLQDELEEVSKLKTDETKPRLNKLLRFLKDRTSVKQGWEEFEIWFTEIHTGFYSQLKKDYPILSDSEMKVCALLRLKMISKDIANVMNVQPASVDIYRHRIRKKLELPAEENLSTFLSQY